MAGGVNEHKWICTMFVRCVQYASANREDTAFLSWTAKNSFEHPNNIYLAILFDSFSHLNCVWLWIADINRFYQSNYRYAIPFYLVPLEHEKLLSFNSTALNIHFSWLLIWISWLYIFFFHLFHLLVLLRLLFCHFMPWSMDYGHFQHFAYTFPNENG